MNKAALKKIPDTLPDKLSDLLILTKKDLQKTSKQENIKFNMFFTWVTYLLDINRNIVNSVTQECSVCLAGAVMLCELPLKVSKEDYERMSGISPNYFKTSLGNKFNAIDSVRCGDIARALKYLKINLYTIKNVKKLNIVNKFERKRLYWKLKSCPDRETDFKAYYVYLNKVIKFLQQEGF